MKCFEMAGGTGGFRWAKVVRKSIKFFCVMATLIYHTGIVAMAYAQSPNVVGKWNVDVVFADGRKYSLRFDAQENGKGSFLLLDPRSKVWGAANPSEGKWASGEGNSVVFSGPVEFLLGNVGRDAGSLGLKGKFEPAGSITGEVEFSPLVGDGPSKHGTFKANRAGSGD